MGKLLVVDDDEVLRRLMHLELSEAYEVIGTGEPEQGLALALEHRPDAILLDLRMPKYSGYELCQTFTSFSRTQSWACGFCDVTSSSISAAPRISSRSASGAVSKTTDLPSSSR